MKTHVSCAALLLVALSTSPLMAQQTPPHERRNITGERQTQREGRVANEFGTAQYNQLIKEIKLTADQKKKLKKEFDLLQQDAQSLRDDAREQLRDQTDDARKQIIQNLSAQWEKILGDHNAAISAILTPDQRDAWQDIRLTTAIRAKLVTIELTAEQDTQFKAAVTAAAKEIARMDSKDIKAVYAIQGKMLKDIFTNILTDDQMSRLMLAPQTPIGWGWGFGRFGEFGGPGMQGGDAGGAR